MTVQFDGMSSHEMVAAAVVERIFNEGSPRKRLIGMVRVAYFWADLDMSVL